MIATLRPQCVREFTRENITPLQLEFLKNGYLAYIGAVRALERVNIGGIFTDFRVEVPGDAIEQMGYYIKQLEEKAWMYDDLNK